MTEKEEKGQLTVYLTPGQKSIWLTFLRLSSKGFPPSVLEISEECGYSRTYVHLTMRRFDEMGLAKHHRGKYLPATR